MKFDLGEGEYRELMHLAYLGEWLVNAVHDPEHQNETAALALQRLLAVGRDLPEIDRDAETGQYFLTAEAANRLYDKYVADYDDHVFWEELIERLAARDLAARRGAAPETIDREEEVAELRPLEEGYRREFEANGIDHLELD